jgi:hypothetical protein
VAIIVIRVRRSVTLLVGRTPHLHGISLASRLRIARLSVARENVNLRDPEGIAVPETTPVEMTPIAAPPAETVSAAPDRQVEVLANSMTIHDLSIERSSIVAYLLTIAPDKQVIALVHALEVGVTELLSRRERFKH